MENSVLAALRQASQGLLYQSETDAPFEPFTWGKAAGELTPQKAAQLAGASVTTPVEEEPLSEFFKYLIEGEDAEKYGKLQSVIAAQLGGARLFRLGSINIDIYIVGRTRDGEWAGLKTQAVET
jgi:hypothetical protein